jgi:hypothetical protein
LTPNFSIGFSFWPSGARSEQARHRRAEHVGVEHADFQAQRGEAEREVAGGGRLADAALAGRDRDDLGDAGDRPRFRRAPMRMAARRRRRRRAGALGGQRRQRRGDARKRLDPRLGGGAHPFQLARPRRRDADGDEDLAVADRHAVDRAGLVERRFAVRPRHGGERGENVVFAEHDAD